MLEIPEAITVAKQLNGAVKGKRIKDYFTHEDMIRFATNWGCPIDQDDFWASDKPMYCWGELENEDKLDVDWTEFPNGF